MKLSPGNGVRGLLPDGDRAEDRINVFKTKTEGNIMKLKKVMALTMAGAMAATTLTACGSSSSTTETTKAAETTAAAAADTTAAAAADNGSSDAETVLQVAFENSISEPVGQGWEKAQEIIKKQGVAYIDEEGDLVTSIVNGKDCVFTCYDADGTCKCAVEKAYREGKLSFYKPVSCHLYPIRVEKYDTFEAVNYNRWSICKAAEILGKKEKLPVYKFLKEPLVRRFGKDWYEALEEIAGEWEKQKNEE